RVSLVLVMIVEDDPGGKAKRLLADAEMRVDPVARHGRRRDEADRLVILAYHLIAEAVAPGLRAESVRPCVGVAFAAQADQDRAGFVLMRLRIAAGLVVADPQVEVAALELGLDAPVAGRTTVVHRQL